MVHIPPYSNEAKNLRQPTTVDGLTTVVLWCLRWVGGYDRGVLLSGEFSPDNIRRDGSWVGLGAVLCEINVVR